jgi:hypothetical protein
VANLNSNSDGLTLRLKRSSQSQASKRPAEKSKVTGTVSRRLVKNETIPSKGQSQNIGRSSISNRTSPLNDGVTVTLASKAPTANVGGTSCPYKKDSRNDSPFSSKGKLTQVQRILPNMPTAYEARGTSGIN